MDENSHDDLIRQVPIRDVKIDPAAEDLLESAAMQPHMNLAMAMMSGKDTQGSGKSYSMVFFSQKVLRKIPGNWTFVIVTDRDELDGQIYRNFANTGALPYIIISFAKFRGGELAR